MKRGGRGREKWCKTGLEKRRSGSSSSFIFACLWKISQYNLFPLHVYDKPSVPTFFHLHIHFFRNGTKKVWDELRKRRGGQERFKEEAGWDVILDRRKCRQQWIVHSQRRCFIYSRVNSVQCLPLFGSNLFRLMANIPSIFSTEEGEDVSLLRFYPFSPVYLPPFTSFFYWEYRKEGKWAGDERSRVEHALNHFCSSPTSFFDRKEITSFPSTSIQVKYQIMRFSDLTLMTLVNLNLRETINTTNEKECIKSKVKLGCHVILDGSSIGLVQSADLFSASLSQMKWNRIKAWAGQEAFSRREVSFLPCVEYLFWALFKRRMTHEQ